MKKSEAIKTPVRAVIVDDEEHCIRSLEELLKDHPGINVAATICDPVAAPGQILTVKPDLLFLDIQMPGKNGFEILEVLNNTNVRPCVIFITAFESYTIQAIRASAFDYLLKPVDKGELAVAVERALRSINQQKLENNYTSLLEMSSSKRIRFNTTGGFIMLDPADIIYIQADWNYSEIYTGNGRPEVVVVNIGAVEEMLPEGQFARINRSVVINLRYLSKVQRGKKLCILKKGEQTYQFRIPLRRIRDLEEML